MLLERKNGKITNSLKPESPDNIGKFPELKTESAGRPLYEF
jgi:hypothetical protein